MRSDRSMTGRLRALVCAACAAALLLAPVAFAASAAEPLGIQTIDTSKYPEVRVSVTVPPSMGAEKPSFEVAENGTAVSGVQATSSTKEGEPARVLLVVDSSGSMAGEPLEDAKAAALRFIEAMDPGASIGLISFDDRPQVLSQYTDDRARLATAIGSLSASGETSLYDALLQAADMAPGQPGTRRSIVVLSDGGDTVSNASFEKMVQELKKTEVPVYAVALKSEEYNPRALELLARQTGGRLVPAEKSSEFSQLFEGIAKEISNVWVLSYSSARPRTADVEIDITATSGDQTGQARGAYRNPGIESFAAGQAVRFPNVEEDPTALMAAALLAFLAVAMLAVGLMLIILRERPNLAQLTFYDQMHDEASGSLWAEDDVRSKVVDAVGYVAGKRGFTELATTRLESAGLPLRPAEYITAHLLFVVAVGVAVTLATGRMLPAVGVVLLATALPVVLIGVIAQRRLERFHEQLPDVLGMISGSLRAGWGIQQAIGLCVQEAPKPSSTELKRVDTETRLGMPLERALQSMAERMSSDDFKAVVTAVAVQREIGGNLAEVLDIVAKTIRERESVRRQIRSLTAEGRLSAYILVALPFVVFGALIFLNPTYMLPLVATPIGVIALMIAVVLLVVGSVWVFSVTRIEV